MSNFLAQLLEPPPPTPTGGIRASQKMTPDEAAAYQAGLLIFQNDATVVNPNVAAQQAEQATPRSRDATDDPALFKPLCPMQLWK